MDGWMDGRMNGWVDGWVDGWTDEWMGGWMDGWVDGWTNEWMGGMDGWMNQDKQRVVRPWRRWGSGLPEEGLGEELRQQHCG